MLNVLISGSLVKDPQERQSSSNRTYATAAMRAPVDGDEAIIVNLIAFSEAATSALLALAKGDALAVSGRAKLSVWEKDGQQRHGLSVVAERVMTLYEVRKKRKQQGDNDEEE